MSSALGSVGPVFALVSLKKFVAFLLVEGSPRLYVMTHVANCLLSPLAPVTFFWESRTALACTFAAWVCQSYCVVTISRLCRAFGHGSPPALQEFLAGSTVHALSDICFHFSIHNSYTHTHVSAHCGGWGSMMPTVIVFLLILPQRRKSGNSPYILVSSCSTPPISWGYSSGMVAGREMKSTSVTYLQNIMFTAWISLSVCQLVQPFVHSSNFFLQSVL